MEIGDWKASADINDVYREIRRLGLESNMVELDAFGLTVLSPEQVGPPELFGRLREALLAVIERRTGVAHDLEQGPLEALDPNSQWGLSGQYQLYYLLYEDPVFEEMVQNPAVLALMGHLVGPEVRISSLDSIVKQAGDGYGSTLGLHHDSAMVKIPMSVSHPLVSNTNWLLTDYTLDNGAFAFVPGSHRRARLPNPGEGVDEAVPVEAPAGSVIVFHGLTWHGAFPRKNPGLRLSVNAYYTRPWMKTLGPFGADAPAEVLARNPASFKTLLGLNDQLGWRTEGPPGKQTPRRAADARQATAAS